MTALGFELINVDDSSLETHQVYRSKLPHGWLVVLNCGSTITFVPFAEDGTGWGKNDNQLMQSTAQPLFGLSGELSPIKPS